MPAEHLTESNFEEKVLKAKEKVLVDFFATWCGPCQVLGPIIDELAGEVEIEKIYKADIDQNQNLAAKFNVASVPTMVIFKDGQEIKRFTGLRNKEQIIKDLKEA